MKNFNKKITLKDISNDSGFSISTISMILNSRADVSFSKETIDKVWKSIKKLGYKNKKFNNLSSNEKKDIIAIFCPNISNAYYSTISQAIEKEAFSKNYKCIILTTFRDEKIEKELIKSVISMNVKGIIFTMLPSHPIFLEEISKQFPLVAIGNKNTSLDTSIIEMNNYNEGKLVAEHLFKLGHRHIAFITTTISPRMALNIRYQRLKAIQDTFKELSLNNENYSITILEERVSPEQERSNLSLEYEVGYSLTSKCLKNYKNKITAFIGNNDVVAYGIIDSLIKKGYKIPNDFSVCGFDNDFHSSLIPISLTTVENFIQDKGKKAFNLLYDKIQGIEENKNCIINIKYKPKLIIRNSTGIIKKY